MPATRTEDRKLSSPRHRRILLAILGSHLLSSAGWAQQQVEARTSFRVKYAVEGAIYLDGGQNAGLRKDMNLTVKRPDSGQPGGFKTIAEVQIVGVGSASAVCEIRSLASPSEAIQVGDTAFLSDRDVGVQRGEQGAASARRYAQVVTFTGGDPLDEEQRAYVPRPPLPEINRARGRIGIDYNAIRGMGIAAPTSYDLGLVLRTDMTRIGGTYWNFGGYWRGRMDSTKGPTQLQTLTDVINRTYQLGFTYVNPQSPWVAGVGRLYLPWAVSLSAIDGGYGARRLNAHFLAGMFGGTTPDPSAWNYNPNRQIAGTFVNYETGSFDSLRLTATVGVAVTRINWNREREFAFTETDIFYKRYLSIYHSLQADTFPANVATSSPPGGIITSSAGRTPGVTQSFLTVRIQPTARVSFDVNHNYFKNPPTFDPRLIGTGLVEKFLFEGFSAGVRLELIHHAGIYTSVGRDSRTGDARAALNQLYGIYANNVFGTGIRADVHYSQFDSSFGRGSFEALSLSHQFREVLHMELQAGQRNIVSALTQQNRARWINNDMDWFVGRHYYLGGGFTLLRAPVLPYNQFFLSMGYRF